MALFSCPECEKNISDKATTCPQCGVPLRPAEAGPTGGSSRQSLLIPAGAVLLVLLAGGGLMLASKRTDYSMVEQIRADQDARGTHDEHVRQRFFRLYEENPNDAMYIYLWSRCVDGAAKRLELAEQGIRADPRFSWNYNMAARSLAQLNRVAEAYDYAVKGAALDPGNLQLVTKVKALKLAMDHKLADEQKPVPSAYSSYDSKENFEKGAVRYQGLFHELIRSPDHADLRAIEKSRLGDAKDSAADAIRGFVVCANPFADSCVRVYVPRESIFDPTHSKIVWLHSGTDVSNLKEDQLVTALGSVVTNQRGENILLADSVTLEAE